MIGYFSVWFKGIFSTMVVCAVWAMFFIFQTASLVYSADNVAQMDDFGGHNQMANLPETFFGPGIEFLESGRMLEPYEEKHGHGIDNSAFWAMAKSDMTQEPKRYKIIYPENEDQKHQTANDVVMDHTLKDPQGASDNDQETSFEISDIKLSDAPKRYKIIYPEGEKQIFSQEDNHFCREAAAHWKRVVESKSPAFYEAHLHLFGDCKFAEQARQKLMEFDSAAGKSPVTQCDHLTRFSGDPMGNLLVKPVAFDRIVLPDAQVECLKALEVSPDNPRFQFQYGRACQKAGDHQGALKWCGKAAAQGYAAAMQLTGTLYENGDGISRDYSRALWWYRRAADHGCTSGLLSIGHLYFEGKGVSKDERQGLEWILRAAELNDSQAAFYMGKIYKDGNAGTKDNRKAFEWYCRSADLGNADAMYMLYYFHINGMGVTCNRKKAYKWLRKSAHYGNVGGMVTLGMLMEKGFMDDLKPYKAALYWYRKAAEFENARAMTCLARLYDNRQWRQRNGAEAARWMEKALRRGDRGAKNELEDNWDDYSEAFRRSLQKRLKQAGIYHGDLHGLLDAKTKQALDTIYIQKPLSGSRSEIPSQILASAIGKCQSEQKTIDDDRAYVASDEFIQSSHLGRVNSTAFSPDGRYVLSAGEDKTLKLWNVKTGREIRTLKGHLKGVKSVDFSPDGKLALSASEDETVKLWEVKTGREVRTFKGHLEGVTSVTFSPDGRYFISGDRDGLLKLWKVDMGRAVLTFSGHSKKVTCISFSRDGKHVFSSSSDKTIKLWDLSLMRDIRNPRGFLEKNPSTAFDPDSPFSFSEEKTFKLW